MSDGKQKDTLPNSGNSEMAFDYDSPAAHPSQKSQRDTGQIVAGRAQDIENPLNPDESSSSQKQLHEPLNQQRVQPEEHIKNIAGDGSLNGEDKPQEQFVPQQDTADADADNEDGTNFMKELDSALMKKFKKSSVGEHMSMYSTAKKIMAQSMVAVGLSQRRASALRRSTVTKRIDATKFTYGTADNGLSHEKMLWVRDQRMVRRVKSEGEVVPNPEAVGDTELEPMPVCSTTTGWFCPGGSCHKSELQEELGLGMGLYFKQLKSLTIMFLIFSVLSLPCYLLFYSGTEATGEGLGLDDAKNFFSTFTLGNVGQDSYECESNSALLPVEGADIVTQDMFCPFGTMQNLEVYAMGNPKTVSCSGRGSSVENLADGCDIPINVNVQEAFTTDCLDQKKCEMKINREWFPVTCQSNENSVFIVVDCKQTFVGVPFSDAKLKKSKLTVLVIVIDVLILLAFSISTFTIDILQKKAEIQHDAYNVQLTDFTIKVKKLPSLETYKDRLQLKAKLQMKLEEVVKKENQVITGLENESKENVGDIVSIFFAQRDYEATEILFKIKQLSDEGQKIQKTINKTKSTNSTKHSKLEAKKSTIIEKILVLAEQYTTLDEEQSEGMIKNAYVTFRSMEGRARALQAYQRGCWSRCYLRCFRNSEYNQKLFEGEWLKVRAAPEPSLILWENLGYDMKYRCGRVCVTSLMAIVLLCFTIGLILYTKTVDDDIQAFSPQVECDPALVITVQEAQDDHSKEDEAEQAGLMYCFCKEMFVGAITRGQDPFEALNTVFPDEKKYCQEWLPMYLLSNTLVFAVPAIIIFLNFISKTILRIMSRFEKRQTKTEEIRSSFVNMMFLSFLNTGVIILLVNFNLRSAEGTHLPLFQGSYSEFSVEWYRLVGSTICVTMLFMIITPHGSNLAFQGLYCFNRCLDRKCRPCDTSKTRKLVQEDYEDVNTGNEIMMEFRYSNMITVIWITFLYSGGIPILYPVVCLFFFVTYWVDKFLLFKFYRKPPSFDSYLANQALGWWKYAVLLHLIGSCFMFVNSNILPPNTDKSYKVAFIEAMNSNDGGFEWTEFETMHMIWYILFGLTLIGVYLIYTIIFSNIFSCFQNCKDLKETYLQHGELKSDFYECILFRSLETLLDQNKNDLKGYKQIQMKRSDKTATGQTFLESNELAEYIQKLKTKEELIKSNVYEIADKQQVIQPHLDKEAGVDSKADVLANHMKFDELIAKLEDLDRNGNLADSEIKDELQSYDMLQNDKYQRLQNFKNALDTYRTR